ncbi:HDOD domain-containing protein [Methylomonas sp. HYX-M1]|uniref:HDOD domain-containing protein n=1 Tax=Methylomonas sp. HYX-M1 TaxID=3139307 RepID=UPI00345B8F43
MTWLTGWLKKSPPNKDTHAPSDKQNIANLPAGESGTCTPPLVTCQQNLSVAELKKFAPIRDLDNETVASLSHATMFYSEGSILFERGKPADFVYYLLEGELIMQPESVNAYTVKAGSTLAFLPINSGKLFGATAKALSDVKILKLPADINRLWQAQQTTDPESLTYLDITLPAEISNNRFFSSFAQAYLDNKLRLPSLPDVAFKLREAMQRNIGIQDAVEIIHIDPAIVTKLIQVANSPLYATAVPINNCLDAVNRIGLNATRNLVLSISLKQLFRSNDKALTHAMYELWRTSIYTSSLAFVLAQECSDLNPEDALLAGLICDIGAIPLFNFADQHPEQYPSLSELKAALPHLKGPVGSLLLHTLGFSAELSKIPLVAENWLYDGGTELGIPDIVILAKRHSYFGDPKIKGLPYINSLPAYAKIADGKLDPDFSLTILQKAQSRIHAAMQFLS